MAADSCRSSYLQQGQSTLEACTTVLLLCLTELCDCSSHVWKWHLKAAGAFLASAGDHSFRYLDSISTISRCKPPLLHEDTKLTDLTADKSTGNFSTAPVDTISGMTPVLFEILGMGNLLAAHRSRRVDELSELGFRTAASHVQSELDSWIAEYNTATIIDCQTSQVMTAFKVAVRLYLHYIGTAVTPILNAAMTIPYGSPLEGCLLCPLVIAEASSTDVERRMLVKEKLMVMENTLGFGHISRARRLLETVWSDGSDGNWARISPIVNFPGRSADELHPMRLLRSSQARKLASCTWVARGLRNAW
ncbi:fungal-specific transcription factor domain-containing protein [Aspergillus alliaceus]|uniref:Fungal-specific transcription factor domain-containing protein n=1 Tax=Petromyces alliaceus TaxID=209559 RepID=A0A5N7BRA6_PETAA|nr:fungal-specific transcription factor domain-containing protein [Aspergillus alliaceus]